MFKKIIQCVRKIPFTGIIGKTFNYINAKLYMDYFNKYLKSLGVKMPNGDANYISPDVYFDGNDYSIITIGKNCVISREVMLLTHDYSIARAFEAIGVRKEFTSGVPHDIGEIVIGDNTFVGARVSVLLGSTIGKNCIIGANSVIKGNIPDNSIVVGNPSKIIGKTDEWASKRYAAQDYKL